MLKHKFLLSGAAILWNLSKEDLAMSCLCVEDKTSLVGSHSLYFLLCPLRGHSSKAKDCYVVKNACAAHITMVYLSMCESL